MGSLNKATLIGNLGKDSELRYTAGGTPVANFSLATTDTWNDKDGNRQEKTEWHRINVWGKTAETLNQYLTKGKQIYLEGRIETRKWQDKEGQDRYTTEIVANRIVLLSGGGGGEGGGQRRSGGGRGRQAPKEFGDEVPGDGFDDAPAEQPAISEDDIPFAWLLPLILPLTATVGAFLV